MARRLTGRRLPTCLAFLMAMAAPLGAQNVPGRLRMGDRIGILARGARYLDPVAPSMGRDSVELLGPLGAANAIDTRLVDLLRRSPEIQGTPGHNAAIGALIGTGVGGIAGLVGANEFCSGSSSCGAKQYVAGFLLGGAAGALLGALIGAVTGSS